MKTPCGVIRDLLPLYAENMTGEETAALIREHLGECQACSDYLKELKNPVGGEGRTIPASSENSLKLVKKGLRSRKVTAVLFAALLVFMAVFTAFSHIVKPEYISYKNSGITVAESANGEVYARFADDVTSCKVMRSVNEDGRSVVEIEAWTSLWDKVLGKTAPSALISSEAVKADVAYYCDLSTQDDNTTVIYGTGEQGYYSVLPRLVLGYYFAAALIATAVCGLICIALRNNKNARGKCWYLFAAPLSYVLAHLMITTRFVSFSASGDFILNCIAALAIYGILICARLLLQQHKQDSIAE